MMDLFGLVALASLSGWSGLVWSGHQSGHPILRPSHHLNGSYVYHQSRRYMKMEEETRDALLPGGWLRSGDVATIDADHEPNVS